MIPLPLLLACAAATLTAVARAEPGATAAPAAAASSPIGPSTRQWLELQRSGAQPGTAHPVPGEVATLVYRRYLEGLRAPAAGTASTPASAEPARPR
jgi:hypothetical protein